MHVWSKKDEWMAYASCDGDVRFISECDADDSELEEVCGMCPVRPECGQWAVSEAVSSVYVCGVRLPDPAHKRALRLEYERLRGRYDDELAARGDF